MVEINEWLWETLYTLKKLYDHGKTSLLEQYAEHVLDGDDVGEIAIQAVYEIFAETRDYWDDGNELETYVFSIQSLTNFSVFASCMKTKYR